MPVLDDVSPLMATVICTTGVMSMVIGMAGSTVTVMGMVGSAMTVTGGSDSGAGGGGVTTADAYPRHRTRPGFRCPMMIETAGGGAPSTGTNTTFPPPAPP